MKAPAAWDLPVRLSHWLLAIGVFVSWGTGHYRHLEWHRNSGYVLLGTLLFRLYWGIVGSANARFGHFVRGPRAVWAYLRTLTRRSSDHAGGHNPLGGWSVLLMLPLLATQIALGLFAVDVDGDQSGPLAAYASFTTGRICAHLHHLCFNFVLASIVLHLAAILFYQIYKRQNLVGPMIRSPVPIATAWVRALLGVCAAAGIAWVTANGLRL